MALYQTQKLLNTLTRLGSNMKLELTLDMIYQMCGDISSEWNGDEAGVKETRAHIATETMEQVELIKENLRQLGCLV